MIKFNKIILTVSVIILLVIAGANIFLIRFWNTGGNKYYLTEINRAYIEIKENGFSDNVDNYKYIESITLLPKSADNQETEGFFNDNNPYVIKTLDSGETEGYIKFSYLADTKGIYTPMLITVNASIILMGLFTIIIMIYIKNQILAPYNRISQIPYDLSKGHLSSGLKENKSKYFGKFVWGLDLLRENLEEQKSRQLALTKEKKALILSISHDIKTPLSAIRLYSRALSENLYNDENRRNEIIGNIRKKADEIEGSVASIVRSSREDFLDLEVNNAEFYLKNLIQDIQAYYEDKLGYISCEFLVGDFDDCLIYGDEDRAREVLENLIENAIKYGDGRRISLEGEIEENA